MIWGNMSKMRSVERVHFASILELLTLFPAQAAIEDMLQAVDYWDNRMGYYIVPIRHV